MAYCKGFYESYPPLLIKVKSKRYLEGNLINWSLEWQEPDETTSLVHKPHRVDHKTAVRLKRAVIVVCWISIVVLVLLGVATFVIAIWENSSASFAFALNAILDCMSSVVILWRYSGAPHTLYSITREKIACLVLGCLFLVSAVIIAIKSGLALADQVLPGTDSILFYFALTNGIVCLCLVVAKLYLAYQLESKSILTDAVNSMIGAILAFSILISDVVFKNNSDIWQIDPITGVVCSVLLLLYGLWIIFESLQYLECKDCTCCRKNSQEDKTRLGP